MTPEADKRHSPDDQPSSDTHQGSYRGVIFDLDGTLTEPGAIDFAAMRRRIGMPGTGSILAWIREHAPNAAERRAMESVVWDEEGKGLGRMELRAGIEVLVETLADLRGVTHAAICTRNSADAIECFDEQLIAAGLPPSAALFPVAIARDEISESTGKRIGNKPAPDPVHEIQRRWGVAEAYPPHAGGEFDTPRYPNFLFVGDGHDDLRSGRRAGFQAGWMRDSDAAPPPIADHVFDGLLDVAQQLRTHEAQ